MSERLILAVAFAGVLSPAQALQDPTQPPQMRETADAAPAAASRLQSVLISSGRKIAVIEGQSYQLGDRVGAARIVRISETEVVLRSGAQTEVLQLLPGVEKTRRPAAGAATKGVTR